jgi:SAM-dependent methyltransferase
VDAATVAVYEDRAREWVARRGEAADGLGRRLADQVGSGPIVDLGCGPGRYLSDLGPSAVGLDATAAMVALARRRGRPLVRADLGALPLAAGSVAGAFARHSYLHLPKQRLPEALGDLRRALSEKAACSFSA